MAQRKFRPKCSLQQWEELLQSPDAQQQKQVDLYACAVAPELKPRTLGAATWFQKWAPKALVERVTHQFEKKTCQEPTEWSLSQQRQWIEHLIHNFDIPLTRIPGCETIAPGPQAPSQCAHIFDDVEDFFTRDILPENHMTDTGDQASWLLDEDGWVDARTVEQVTRDPANQMIVSPAECYVVLYANLLRAQQVWIKGKQFTAHRLLGTDHGGLYDDATVAVCRLTPRHYHRFHVPVSGRVVALAKLGTRRLSVQRGLVTSATNVLTENVRYVLYISTAAFGLVAMVIVGATCVSSVVFHHLELQSAMHHYDFPTYFQPLQFPLTIHQGDLLGDFRYGGSTIVLLVPHSSSSQHYCLTRLIDASALEIETQIAPGQPLLFHMGGT